MVFRMHLQHAVEAGKHLRLVGAAVLPQHLACASRHTDPGQAPRHRRAGTERALRLDSVASVARQADCWRTSATKAVTGRCGVRVKAFSAPPHRCARR